MILPGIERLIITFKTCEDRGVARGLGSMTMRMSFPTPTPAYTGPVTLMIVQCARPRPTLYIAPAFCVMCAPI